MVRVNERQRLERFAQAHLVRQDAPELILPQELQPRHALPLIGTQHIFERAKRWTRELRLATLLRRALAPTGRRLHLPARLLAQRGVKEARLRVAEAITSGVLLRRAVAQHLGEFLQRTCVNECDSAILQSRRAVAGQDQALDVRRRKLLAVGGGQRHFDVEPPFARRPDFKARFEPLKVLGGAVLKPFFE